MQLERLDTLELPTPDLAKLERQYLDLKTRLGNASSAPETLSILSEWEHLRKDYSTWDNFVHLRFQQDTRVEERRRDREKSDEWRPKVTNWEVEIKKKLLESPRREFISQTFGEHILALWDADLASFQPAIENDLVQEAKLQAEYTELTAGAKIPFEGQTLNFAGIVKYREHPERSVRFEAEKSLWTWFHEHSDELDRIYADATSLRDSMAHKLGYRNFVGLGYKRMKRVDYTENDVAEFRRQVQTRIVPLAAELRRQQAQTLGLDSLMFWDEGISDPKGNPRPIGNESELTAKATHMFDELSPQIGAFFRLMKERHLIDLTNREGKAPGGFCTSLPSFGVPFIFANFNGTKHDVEVFTHEMGHALQNRMSSDKPLLDYHWPTCESCEIHSMGLEFLAWPHMDKFFGEDADRFRALHLKQSLLFIPYGVAVDHFQHLVYSLPEATPQERHEMWQNVERIYLPWRNYGELPHVSHGGLWQFQRHIYLDPFYYIDYTLALVCALQLWVKSRQDFSMTLKVYLDLCSRGGEAPFQELVRGAGLKSPFLPGCLDEVAREASNFLGLT